MGGHFLLAHKCRFRRNTLLEYGDTRIVISTVGLLDHWVGDPRQDKNIRGFDTVGLNAYFETMAFYAKWDERYWDADVSRQIYFDSPWAINIVDADDKANDMHEIVVSELVQCLKNNKIRME